MDLNFPAWDWYEGHEGRSCNRVSHVLLLLQKRKCTEDLPQDRAQRCLSLDKIYGTRAFVPTCNENLTIGDIAHLHDPRALKR